MSYAQRQKIQSLLAQANELLAEAKAIADQADESFEFLGRTYQPKRIVSTGGHWDHEPASESSSWDSSDDWQASGIGC